MPEKQAGYCILVHALCASEVIFKEQVTGATPASAWWLIGRTGAEISTYNDTTVVPGKYRYRICGRGSDICGTSGKVTVPPSPLERSK